MKSIIFSYGNVNFSLSQNALIDTIRFREFRRYASASLVKPYGYYQGVNRIYKNFELNDTNVSVDGYQPTTINSYRAFFDVETSIAKYLFSGDNSKGYKYGSEYLKNYHWNFNLLQGGIRANTGIGLSVFRSGISRIHFDINFDCGTPRNAEKLRDFLFDAGTIPHLPNKYPYENTRYWNCRSYILDDDDKRKTDNDGLLVQPNRTFALYTKGRYLHGETRYNNSASVRGLIKSKFGKSLILENNFKSFSQLENMNKILWRDLIHLFAESDRERILEAYK